MTIIIFILCSALTYLHVAFGASQTIFSRERLDQIDLAVTYVWPPTATNLDTSTQFLSDSGGSECTNSREYVEWGGDDTGPGGSETSVVLLAKARRLSAVSNFAVIQLNAAYDPGNIAPAAVMLSLRRTGTTTDVSRTVRMDVFAGTKRGGCASSPVAIVFVQVRGTQLRIVMSNDDLIRPTPRPMNYFAAVYRDPHFMTFDNLYSHCQGKGEFLLTKTEGLEIQGRFGGELSRVTLPVGFVVKHGDLPRVQVSVVKDPTNEFGIPDTSQYTSFGPRCLYLFVVGDERRLLSEGTGNDDIVLTFSNPTYIITFPSTQILIRFRMSERSTQCMTEDIRIILPSSFTTGKTFIGLLGTPNGDIHDDIMATDGTPISTFIPNEEGRYNYCRDNWCLRDDTNSLFFYEGSTGHNTHHECDKDFSDILSRQLQLHTCGNRTPCIQESVAQSAVDRRVLREIRRTCGVNEACLFEGMSMAREVGADVALESATEYLQIEADHSKVREEESTFSFSPSTIQARKNVSIRVTLEVDGVNSSATRYALYRLNVQRDRREGKRLGYMVKLSPTENIFFANIFIRSESVGQRLSFRAVPEISGSETTTSSLYKDAVNAISSYCVVPPPIGSPDTDADLVTATPEPTDDIVLTRSSLADVQLIVRYSWSSEIEDLDTATKFLTEIGGHLCSPFGQYVQFFGNVETRAGNEFSIVRIGQAESDGQWTDNTKIEFFAGVHNDDPHPATMRISLLDVRTREIIEGSTIQENIAPGLASGCANTTVATLLVSKNSDEYTFNVNVE